MERKCLKKNLVKTYFDDDSYADFLNGKAEVGITKNSDFGRYIFKCFMQNKMIEDAIILAAEIQHLKPELSRVGGNLNQLARSFNQVQYVNQEQLEKAHHDLRLVFKEVIKVLEKVDDEIREEFTPWG